MLPRLIGEDITVTMGMAPELQSVRADRNQSLLFVFMVIVFAGEFYQAL